MVIISKENIGLVIKQARKKAKLKQNQLAEMGGFTEKHLSRIENGKYLPKLEHFLSISSILNLNLNDFGILSDNNIPVEKSELINKIMIASPLKIKMLGETFDYLDKIIEVSKSK